MNIEQGEGPAEYIDGIKCYKWFCWKKPVFRKLIVKFPAIIRYVPACEKHK